MNESRRIRFSFFFFFIIIFLISGGLLPVAAEEPENDGMAKKEENPSLSEDHIWDLWQEISSEFLGIDSRSNAEDPNDALPSKSRVNKQAIHTYTLIFTFSPQSNILISCVVTVSEATVRKKERIKERE